MAEMDITKLYIGGYKLKKCLIAQFKGINLMAKIFILILLAFIIFQQAYYPPRIREKEEAIKKHLDYLQIAYGNISNQLEDIKIKVEDYTPEKWKDNLKDIKLMLESLDEKVSYFESAINNYYSLSRTRRQKYIF